MIARLAVRACPPGIDACPRPYNSRLAARRRIASTGTRRGSLPAPAARYTSARCRAHAPPAVPAISSRPTGPPGTVSSGYVRPRRSLRLPPDHDADVRADRRLRARCRRGHRHRREGALPDRAADRRGRILVAPPGAHGRDRPRVSPARDAHLAAAGPADDDRADVPVRPAAGGPVPPVLAVRHRGHRRSRSRDRCRDHRARDAGVPRRGARGRPGPPELDR